MNLFIVENSNYLRERLARLVSRRQGVQVVGHAANARDAIDEIRQLKPDVVLLDIRLDQGSGLDVLKQIKTRGQPPVVIVLTNYAYPQYRERFLSSGADYFFDKSTELDLMLQALDLLRYRFQRQPAPGHRTEQKPRIHTARA
jgi:two-component system, NarL family, response regulator DevR